MKLVRIIVLAACMVTGGVASYRSAGALFGLRGIKPGPVEITVEGKRAPRLSGVTTHQTNRLHAATIGIIPLTTPLQSLLDLAESGIDELGRLQRQALGEEWPLA